MPLISKSAILSAVFSSDRWDKSMGGSDLFIAYFKDEQEEQFYNEAGTALTMLMSQSTSKVAPRPALKSVATDSQIVYRIDWTPSLEDDFITHAETQKNIEGIANICQKYKDIRF